MVGKISLPTERKRWEELSKIRAMPIGLAAKRELKTQLAVIPMLKLTGWHKFQWRRHRLINSLQLQLTQRIKSFIFMQRSLQNIEVRCGTSIVNVFLFIKWTAFLNLWIFIIIGFFLILPIFLGIEHAHSVNETCPADFNATKQFNTSEYWQTNEEARNMQLADCCTKIYESKGTKTAYHSPLVYGYYQRSIIRSKSVSYDYSEAYVIVPVSIFGLCLIIMVRQIGVGIKEVILAKEGEFYRYSNLIFSGWDHYTKDTEGAKFKKKILKHEIKIALKIKTHKVANTLKTRKQKWNRFFARILANVIVVIIQIVVGVIIYYVSDFSVRQTVNTQTQKELDGELTWDEQLRTLGVRILPSTCISIVNMLFPALLRHIGKLEKYSPNAQMTWILIRTLFIRLLSLTFAGYKFYYATYCTKKNDTCAYCIDKDKESSRDEKSKCWETFIGIQIYLLVATDFAFKVIMTLVINNGRRILAKKCERPIFKRLGRMKFNVVRHSLDIVYVQCLAWFFYFAPFIPFVVFIYCIAVFYLKKFSVMINCRAVPDTYRTAKTTTIFVVAKLISFAAAIIVIGTVMNHMEPSRGCGPFREYRKPWDAVRKIYGDEDSVANEVVVKSLSSPGVTIPLAIIMFLVAYYYYSVATANKAMVENLRHLLVLEGHDKQYLFARLNALRRQSIDSTSSTTTTATSATTKSKADSSYYRKQDS